MSARGLEVLRYDYRGIGESTGDFDEMSFAHWEEDIQLLTTWLNNQSPKLPLILHGLELGAVLAARTFHSGIGDALLLWSPPENANQALRSTLIRWVGLAQLLRYTEERRTAGDSIRELESGSAVEVEGYSWSPRLWRDSLEYQLPPNMSDDQSAVAHYDRPVKVVVLGANAAPLAKKGMVGGAEEIKDLDWLYEANFDWMNEVIFRPQGVSQ
jgi:alpha-beta hydrolase superfamily lysophospholipase